MSNHEMPAPTCSMSRRQAAQLLKLARSGSGEVVTEAIDWAYAAMPDRAIVLRLKIRSLLETGQFEAADALIAQALLIYPMDPVVSTLRAERLLAKGRSDSAAREIELVLARYPQRPSALVLGAKIAAAHGEHSHAATLLERAVEARPLDTQIRAQLVEALLAADQPAQAAQQLGFIADAPVLLEASVMRAQGRAIDALARLQATWSTTPQGEQADEVAAAIVELLEETGEVSELTRFTKGLDVSHPLAMASAARAWLALGRFDEAMALGAMLLKRRACVAIGRGIVLVAATMKGNFGIARRVVRQLITSELTIDRISLADLWRRAMIGKLICRHTSLTQAAGAGQQGVLAGLAQSAADLFREQLSETEASGNLADAAELLHLIRQCTLPRVEVEVESEAAAGSSPDDPSQRQELTTARRAA